MADEPKIDIKLNDKLEGTLVMICPQCKRKTEKLFRDISLSKKATCSCGFAFTFTGDSLSGIQRSLGKLKRTLDRFGK